MKRLFFILMLYMSGCSTLFNSDKYNPNPTPMHENNCHTDSIKVDTIRLTNGVDHIIILDTLKIK
jgi:uncharacterized protein YceK